MTEDKSQPLYGFYRALVVNNQDPDKFGKIQVWVPDIMQKIDKSKGLWAYPANNPMGGRNTDTKNPSYAGTSYIPMKDSWVWVFFECGDENRPFYWASLDIEASKVLAECQVGSNYQDKWVIFKSTKGRCVVISDDPDDARVEITGKKRNLSSPPAGDTASVYTIDGNMTTILMDERDGKEKILIRTHNGDFVNIDVTNRKLNISFESDIQIKTNGKLMLRAYDDIDIKGLSNVNIQAGLDLNIKSGGNLNEESSMELNAKGNQNVNIEAGATMNNRAAGPILSDGASIADMSGAASPAGSASEAVSADPQGNRD